MKDKKLGKIIKWFDERNYGFIKEFETGKSYYVHRFQIHDDEVIRGAVVEFSIYQNKKNPELLYASNVYVVEVPEVRHTKY